jgi:hypothetical protein
MRDHSTLFPRILAAIYPDSDELEKAREILARYKGDDPLHNPYRVWLAILKLSGSDLDKLDHYTDVARTDFRDVLAWAEYPNQMDSDSWRMDRSSPEYQAILKKDQEQYEAWLASFGLMG